MPNLAAFREQGLTFSRAFCPAPHCCPSRASFFSGLYPAEHGVWHNVCVENAITDRLKDGVRLWSEDLAEAGYRMDFSGKWHVSNIEGPEKRGWNPLGVTARPGAKMGSDWSDYRQMGGEAGVGVGEREPGQIRRPGYPKYMHYGTMENPFGDEDTVDAAIEAMRSRKGSEEPWCQFVGTLGPHDPYFVPQRFLDLYNIEDIELPDNFDDAMLDKPGLYRRTRGRFDQLGREEHREAIRHYLAFCSYEDYLFGRVLEELEASGEADNTVVVYLSDHGDYMGEHGLWCKGLPCFDSAYHVPAIVRWPAGLANPGRVEDSMIELGDFCPTFLELAGVDVDRPISGKSLAPFLRDEKPEGWRDAVFTQTNGNELYGIQRSIRTDDWRFVYNGFDFDELYDLKSDPGQQTNLAADEKYSVVVDDLMKRIWRFGAEHGETATNPYIMVSLAKQGPAAAF